MDDDEHMRRALARAVRAWGVRTVDEAPDPASAREFIETRPHLAWIIDVNLKTNESGLDVLAWARAGLWTTRALVLTGDDRDRLANAALRVDAFFARKPLESCELVKFLERAVRFAAQERAAPSPSPSLLDLARRYGRMKALSDREKELVVALASGVARQDLAPRLGIAEPTVKTMVKHIRIKTGVEHMQELLQVLLRRAAGLGPAWPDELPAATVAPDDGADPAGEMPGRLTG